MKINGYIIRIQAQISEAMAGWFEGAGIQSIDEKDTLLVLSSPDQALLFGLLLRVRDLGIRLVSVTPFDETNSPMSPESKGK